MKKLFFLSALFLSASFAVAQINEIPDSSLEQNSQSKEEINYKIKDPRTLQEKFRSKFHLKPSKKVYYHNIDKSHQPITNSDYHSMAKDIIRSDFTIPEPDFSTFDDIIMPDYRVIKYNTPPGQRNIDLSHLVNNRTASSLGILSPDLKKIVYTKAFFYPKFSQTSSCAYYIPVSESKNPYDALYKTNVISEDINPIVSVGMDEMVNYQFITLFPIDWSKDSSKIAFKEKIGSNLNETWQTNIIIYDFNTKSWKRLTAIREAIIYWWRQNKQIDLKDYMWDIFPVGWDKNNPDRLICYAYAFTKSIPFFLGTWSIDFNEEKSSLISIDSTQAVIDLNGFGLKEINLEH